MTFYEANVKLKEWDSFKRVFEYEWQVNIDDVRLVVLKDVFYKIEDWDLEQIEEFSFDKIDEKTYENIKNTERCVELILNNNNWIIENNSIWRKVYN